MPYATNLKEKRMNTEEERERTREAFRFSRANLALEGFEPGPDVPLMEDAIINGRLTGEEVIELSRKRALGHITEEEYMKALAG
jgi:DNA invertase Pin-like site-specific DNA recombinase